MDGAFRRETMELFCFCHNYITPEKGLQAGKQSKKKKKQGMEGKIKVNSAKPILISVKRSLF